MKRLAVLLALFILVPFAGPASAAPNIVVIMTDDLDAASLAHMPLTRLLIGDAGMTFSQHIVSSPLCCPSRASFFRGQYAHNHRVWQNGAYHRLRLLEGDT